MFRNDKQVKIAFFINAMTLRFSTAARLAYLVLSLEMIKFNCNESRKQEIPRVLWLVTGAHAVLLLNAAIQLKVLLPVI